VQDKEALREMYVRFRDRKETTIAILDFSKRVGTSYFDEFSESVVFDADADETSILGFLALADLVLIPSLVSASFRLIMQAMAMSRVVITPNVAGRGEILGFNTGVLIDTEGLTQSAVTVKMIRSVEVLVKDKETRAILGSMAKDDIASRFNVEKLAACLMRSICTPTHPHVGQVSPNIEAIHSVLRANAMLARQANVVKLAAEEERGRLAIETNLPVPFTVPKASQNIVTNIRFPQLGVTLLGFSIMDLAQSSHVFFMWSTTKRIDQEFLFFLHVINKEVCYVCFYT
jgi:hypothetical protein